MNSTFASLRTALQDDSWPEKAFEQLHTTFAFTCIPRKTTPSSTYSPATIETAASERTLKKLIEQVASEVGDPYTAACFVIAAATASYLKQVLEGICASAAVSGLRQSTVSAIVNVEGDRLALSSLLLEIVRGQTAEVDAVTVKTGCLAALRASHALIEGFSALCCSLQLEEPDAKIELTAVFKGLADVIALHRELVGIKPVGQFPTDELSSLLGIH